MFSAPFFLAAAGGLLLGAFFAYRLALARERARVAADEGDARSEAARTIARAREEAEDLRRVAELAGREEGNRLRERLRAEWEKEERRSRGELVRMQRRQERRSATLSDRAERADRRTERLNQLKSELDGRSREMAERKRELDRRDNGVEVRSKELDARSAELDALVVDLYERDGKLSEMEAGLRTRLEQLSGMTAEEAKHRLVEEMEDEARAAAQATVREITERAKEEGESNARRIIADSIQRVAADCTPDNTVSVVHLPSDEMKGRIIGREGRNIRSFEELTGVNVVVDDTPEAVVLSCFDPRRREIARLALERLVEDGRIHPPRIEDAVEKARQDIDLMTREVAEDALRELGIHNVHHEIVRRLGMLRFRTSYGQNQLQHSIEVAWLAGTMATELNLDVGLAKRAGLLHDVGKGFSHDHEGTHVELGHRLCRTHGEHDVVLNSIRAHHDEEEHRSPEAFLVSAADAISGSRPGARREMAEEYIKRIESLEEIAMDHDGVERCFAVNAGREVRIMVQPETVPDADMDGMSKAVARRLEAELRYPGKIKVVVVRETRAEDYAR